jgi:hypothetical protein
MTMQRQLARLTLVLAVLAAAGGCGESNPYIYKAREFDRNDKAFNKPPADRVRLTICYNGVGTTDHDIAKLAEAECAKFGKHATALSDGFGPCPLLTPVAASFACVAADDKQPPAAGATPVSGTP